MPKDKIESPGIHHETENGQQSGTSEADDDLNWFSSLPFLESMPDQSKSRLFAEAHKREVRKGERLIAQGEEGEDFFLIRHGTCIVILEKDGAAHPMGRLGPGEIVGEMAVLTGEKRMAHVDAESDMEVWSITRAAFDTACNDFPQIRKFLTSIVASRLYGALFTSDRTIGRYVVGETIGSGGWSVVYQGIHSSLDMPVAVKMLRHDVAMDKGFLEQFRNEAKIIARLNHENIVKVYDVQDQYRTVFIVMEYIEGQSLGNILAHKRRLSPAETVGYLIQICSGLIHAHEKGVIHKDVKPANILVRKDGRVKVVDFGLAGAPGISQSGYIAGTFLYISPEQIRRLAVDERSDIYSLGIMAFEMLTGHRACTRHTVSEALFWHLEHDVKEPITINPDLPEELNSIVRRATRRDPDARYRNVSELLSDLHSLADSLGTAVQRPAIDRLNMMSLFLLYRDEQQAIMKKLIRDFSRELEKVGAHLRGADFKDLLK